MHNLIPMNSDESLRYIWGVENHWKLEVRYLEKYLMI